MTGREWRFEVGTSPLDDVKRGVLVRRVSRVVVSADEYPSEVAASEVAAVLAATVHGGSPTFVRRVVDLGLA